MHKEPSGHVNPAMPPQDCSFGRNIDGSYETDRINEWIYMEHDSLRTTKICQAESENLLAPWIGSQRPL